MSWTPHITVATVVENNAAFLLVEECIDNAWVLNQPAGHLEKNESLIDAAQRETLEETRWEIEIKAFLGVSLYIEATHQQTYLRILFSGHAIAEHLDRKLDTGIRRALWMSYQEIEQRQHDMRSPMVFKAINRYLSKPHYPLSMLEYMPLQPPVTQ